MLHNEFDHDKIYCPITLTIMRHPVRISSGYYIELEVLHRLILQDNKLICPVTRKKITSIQYDEQLKNDLDTQYNRADRYPDYDYKKDDLLLDLEAKIPNVYKSLRSSVKYGLATGLCMYYFAQNSLSNPAQLSIAFSLLFGSLEFYLQQSRGMDTLTFFSQKCVELQTHIRSIDAEAQQDAAFNTNVLNAT